VYHHVSWSQPARACPRSARCWTDHGPFALRSAARRARWASMVMPRGIATNSSASRSPRPSGPPRPAPPHRSRPGCRPTSGDGPGGTLSGSDERQHDIREVYVSAPRQLTPREISSWRWPNTTAWFQRRRAPPLDARGTAAPGGPAPACRGSRRRAGRAQGAEALLGTGARRHWRRLQAMILGHQSLHHPDRRQRARRDRSRHLL
jgi:hypothetical protein